MKNQCLIKHFFIAALIAVLAISMVPSQSAHAQTTSTSDLAVSLVSLPKHVKACKTFEMTFTVTNLGPDPATNLDILVMLPDPFTLVGLLQAPATLAVGEAATVTAVIKVVAFVPGEPRNESIGANVTSNPYPDISIDPNLDNNTFTTQIRLISKPTMSCF